MFGDDEFECALQIQTALPGGFKIFLEIKFEHVVRVAWT
jgi:hypothetical protein